MGAWPCIVRPGTLLDEIYFSNSKSEILNSKQIQNKKSKNQKIISERHRHRYEVNNEFKEKLEKCGLVFSGFSPDGKLVEAIELSKKIHPFFVGTQFHPEYKSRPLDPHPIFMAFVDEAVKNSKF